MRLLIAIGLGVLLFWYIIGMIVDAYKGRKF